ncbi:MAG: flippase-like domain-containing protein [Bacteroidales bacterium]|nr:flippase-like domain-containing protein [Bacteroidales bacterium]
MEYRHLHDYVSDMFAQGMESRRGVMWIAVAVLAAAVLVLVAVTVYYRRRRNSLPEGHWMKKIASVFAGFSEGIMSLKHVRQPFWFAFHTVGLWFCYWIMLYFALHSLDALSGTGGGIALITLVMGTVGNMITPGGIGLYPVIVSETLVLFGFPKVLGYTAGWISWGTQTLAIIIGGVAALILLPLMNKEKK